MNLRFGKTQPVNLVIKDHVIRYVDAKGTNLQSVKAFGERYLQTGWVRDGKISDREHVEAVLEECVDTWKLKNRDVNFIVPDSTVLFKKLSIPNDIPDDEIKGYLYFEIGTTIHLPFEDPIFDFYVLGQKDEKKEILLFGAPEQIINDYTELLEDVKLTPKVADISPLCTYRLYHALDLFVREEHLLLLQISIGSISLSIFHEEKPVFMRNIHVSSDEVLWSNKINDQGEFSVVCEDIDKMKGNLKDNLMEIERVVNFYKFSINQGKAGITKTFLTGDHPYLSYIKEQLDSTTGMQSATFTDHVFETIKGEIVPTQFYLPLSLVLKEVK
ncbi:pilus assembly protein PilM [Bacillaceae bacterium IKA-2]|nr:pilus assembly protein PilM [Bacillaceae bacterium IKA-2]